MSSMENKCRVLERYPQAFASNERSRFWRVYRNPAGLFDGTYLGAAVTKHGAWDKAWKNIQSGPQCCFPHPLDFTACDSKGNVLEVELCANGKVLLNILEREGSAKAEKAVKGVMMSQMAIFNRKELTAIRDALTKILEASTNAINT